MVIELCLPIEDFWELEKDLNAANYLLASNEPSAEVQNAYKKVLMFASKFAVKEKERSWLHEKCRTM